MVITSPGVTAAAWMRIAPATSITTVTTDSRPSTTTRYVENVTPTLVNMPPQVVR